MKLSFKETRKSDKPTYESFTLADENKRPIASVLGAKESMNAYRSFRIDGEGVYGVLYVKRGIEMPENGEMEIK